MGNGDVEQRPEDDPAGFTMMWYHTVINVRADSKGQIRRGGFIPGHLYKIISPAQPPKGVQSISITGMGQTEEGDGQ